METTEEAQGVLVAAGWTELTSAGPAWEASGLTLRVSGPRRVVTALLDEVAGGRCVVSARDGVPGLLIARASPRALTRRVQTPDGLRPAPTEEALELEGLLRLLRDADRAPDTPLRPAGGRVRTPSGGPADVRVGLADDGRAVLETVGAASVLLDPAACVELAGRLLACASGRDPDGEETVGETVGETDEETEGERWEMLMERGFMDAMYETTWRLIGAEDDPRRRAELRSRLEQAVRRSAALQGAFLEEPWTPPAMSDAEEGMTVCRRTPGRADLLRAMPRATPRAGRSERWGRDRTRRWRSSGGAEAPCGRTRWPR